MDWDALRRAEFPVAARWAYLDHAAVAPLPTRSARAMRDWVDAQERDGVVRWSEWKARLEAARARAAALIGADPAEVAFVNSTTQGIGYVAEGFPWREADSVVTVADEYPSNVYPWMNLEARGVSLRRVPTREGRVRVDDVAAALDRTTRLLTVSHVEFATGFRNDLDALGNLCRERGVALFVDAIQGLGALPLDVSETPVDFLAADGHKWLLGPEGAGLLFVRREWIDRLRCVVGLGSHSVVNAHNYHLIDFTLRPDAGRWEGGCYNMAGVQGFGASLGLFLEAGPAAASRRVLERAEAVRELARSAGWQVYGPDRPEEHSGIVSLRREGSDPDAVVRAGRERGVVISCRAGRLRVSPHVYTGDDDLGRLADLLGDPAAARG